ncbi:hypothetical protein [Bartonella kosoyi]|uniref:hypothetical protein n=1 Tax=Bartonella kosoyi TaxID=2133959 RepID=UPI0014258269|nr:hypothetical protein [Bartonella kosoyi]
MQIDGALPLKNTDKISSGVLAQEKMKSVLDKVSVTGSVKNPVNDIQWKVSYCH